VSTLYAESSAVLRWLLGTEDAASLQDALTGADLVITSVLTSTEVARTLRRLVATGQIEAPAGNRCWDRYTAARGHWNLYAISDPVLDRASQVYPREPVRTLDAIHLATAALIALEVTPPVVLSVDRLVRANVRALGLDVLPAGA
jgi:predicted nucleic acid-binding protein